MLRKPRFLLVRFAYIIFLRTESQADAANTSVKHIPFSYIFLFQTKAQPEQNYLQKSSKLRRYAFQIQNPTYLSILSPNDRLFFSS